MLEIKKIIDDISNEYIMPPVLVSLLLEDITQSLHTSEIIEERDIS